MRTNKMSNKKRGSAFFENFIREYGEDFLNKVPPLTLTKKMHMLFKDMAYGNIDLEKHGKYFANPDFVQLICQEASKKRFYHGTHVNGNRMLQIYKPETEQYPMFPIMCKEDMQSFEAYCIISEQMNNLLNTGNVEYLTVLANNIRPFKYAV